MARGAGQAAARAGDGRVRAAGEPEDDQGLIAATNRHLAEEIRKGRFGEDLRPKRAAAALGLNPTTLHRRLKKLGIQPPGQAEDAEDRRR